VELPNGEKGWNESCRDYRYAIQQGSTVKRRTHLKHMTHQRRQQFEARKRVLENTSEALR